MDLFARSVQHSRVRSVVASSTEKLEHCDFITLRRFLENESSKNLDFGRLSSLGLGRGLQFSARRSLLRLHETVRFTTDEPSIHLCSVEIGVWDAFRNRERIFVARILWTSSPNIRGTFVVDGERFEEYCNASEAHSLVTVHLHYYSGILWRADGHERLRDTFISH